MAVLNYSYTPSGSISFRNATSEYIYEGSGRLCFAAMPYEVTVTTFVNARFSARDIVYYVKKARNGILEPICIKKVFAIETYNEPYPLYLDTFNSYWTEELLYSEEEALAVVEAYSQRILSEQRAYDLARNPCRAG